MQDRWVEVRSTSLSNNAILGKISAYETVLNKSGAIEKNFQKWDILSTYVWPNNFIGNTYDAEIEYIESWITARTAWLDQAINNL